MAKKRSKTGGFVVQPLRVPGDMQARIRELSQKARLSDADIMRMAIDRGIGAVEQMFELHTKEAA